MTRIGEQISASHVLNCSAFNVPPSLHFDNFACEGCCPFPCLQYILHTGGDLEGAGQEGHQELTHPCSAVQLPRESGSKHTAACKALTAQ